MNYLKDKIRQANQANQAALIPFIPAGFPTKDKFWDIIEELDNYGADIIEIGIPFTDPVADGYAVEKAYIQALKQGIDLEWILNGLLQRKLQSGIVLIGYFNPFLQYGIQKLSKQCKLAGVHACIILDLPLEESMEVEQALSKNGIDLIPLVGPNTSLKRMQEHASIAKAYVYVVSSLGDTDSCAVLSKSIEETLINAKIAFKIPIALGVELNNSSLLDNIPNAHKPEAIIFSSALLTHIENGLSVKDFFKVWKNSYHNPKK